MLKQNGVRGLWAGLGELQLCFPRLFLLTIDFAVPSLLRDVPFSALYWLLLEQLKVRLNTRSWGVSHGEHAFLCVDSLWSCFCC